MNNPAGSQGQNAQNAVQIINMAFQPQQITVPVGTTVTWTNADTTAHTVTAGTADAPTGEFDSGNLDPGATFTYTFDQPGTFAYFCSIHPNMVGTVTVQ
jgi:plastocyanin